MFFEPDRLDQEGLALLRFEDEIRAGKRQIPGTFLSVSFRGLVYPLRPDMDAILAQPTIAECPLGLSAPLLTPGPMEASIALLEQSGPVSAILERLGRRGVASVVLVLRGSMRHEAHVTIEGSRFLSSTSFGELSLVVIPPGDKRELIATRDSVLLLASTGPVGANEADVDLDLSDVLGHFQLREQSLTPLNFRRLRRADSEGNSVLLRRHKRAGTLCSPGGVVTIAMHRPQELRQGILTPVIHPDIRLVHPKGEGADLSAAFSLDVNLA